MSCCPSLAVLILGVLFAATGAVTPTSGDLREYDLCSSHPPDVLVDTPGDSVLVYVHVAQGATSTQFCEAEFTACDNCRFRVSAFQPQFEYPECWQASWAENYCPPHCVYLILFDGDYKSRRRRVTNSLTADGFETESKSLQIVACNNYNSPTNSTMMLRLTSVEKIQHITGNMFEPSLRRTFMSPNFPSPYVRNNEYYTYTFESSSQDQFITVTFDDWILSPYSTVKFDGANIVNTIDGGNIRPYIVSSGKSMNMTFCTGERRRMSSDYNFIGFKGQARFFTNLKDIPHIEPGCDRLVSTSEGGILHLNAAADGQNRDCIWIIKKMGGFDGVYVKIMRYKTRYELMNTCDYSLEVREGLTSNSAQRLNLRPNDHIPNYAVQLSEDGFYIRIKGCYFDDSVVLSYAMYLDDCDDYREYYKCDNGRCIADHLKCDTYDHCGDSSDEIPSMCGRVPTKIRSGVGDSSSNVSNSINASYDYSLSIHVIIPLVVSVVLGIGIMCLLILLVRRCRRLSNSVGGRPQNSHGRRSRGRGFNWRNRSLQMSVTMSSGEHPPSYEDVIRSTPIGQLNMAFSWSACESAFTQPPPYDEAVSPLTAQTAVNNSTHAALTNSISGSSCLCGTSSNLPQYHSRPFLVATLSASLCTAADACLNSASPGSTTDNTHRLDVVLSSENMHTQNPLISADCVSDSFITSSNQSKNKDEPNSKNSSDGNIAKAGNIGLAVLESRTSPKKKNDNLSVHSYISQRNNKPVAGKSTNIDENHCSNSKDVDTVRSVRGESNRSRKQGRVLDKGPYRTDSAQELSTLGATANGFVSMSESDGYSGLRMTHSSRSQSCADLSFDIEQSRFLEDNGERWQGDKRFSYAGAGDVSLMRRGLDPSCNSMDMLNTQGHPSSLSTVSPDSRSDINRISNITSTGGEAVSSKDLAPKKNNPLSNRVTVFCQSRTDKPGVSAPSSLDPLLENSYDDCDVKVTSVDVAAKSDSSRYKDSKVDESVSRNILTRNKMYPVLSEQYRSETSLLRKKQVKPDVPQKISKHKSKHSQDVPATREVEPSHNMVSSFNQNEASHQNDISHSPGEVRQPILPAYAKDYFHNQHKHKSLQSGNISSSAVKDGGQVLSQSRCRNPKDSTVVHGPLSSVDHDGGMRAVDSTPRVMDKRSPIPAPRIHGRSQVMSDC